MAAEYVLPGLSKLRSKEKVSSSVDEETCETPSPPICGLALSLVSEYTTPSSTTSAPPSLLTLPATVARLGPMLLTLPASTVGTSGGVVTIATGEVYVVPKRLVA